MTSSNRRIEPDDLRSTPVPQQDAEVVELSRCVRFTIPFPRFGSLAAAAGPHETKVCGSNSFAGLPSMRGLGAHYELVISVLGKPDASTGYIINIAEIDRAVRDVLVPWLIDRVSRQPARSAEAILQEAMARLAASARLPVFRIEWRLTPYYSLAMSVAAPETVLMSQSFEFAAAHRLHCSNLDAATNRKIFGKCNNASGHGHNYRVEVAVHVRLNAHGMSTLPLEDLERIVDETVIQRFDHKHLNIDVPEFADLNPSVENITRIAFDLLEPPIAAAGADLAFVRVWENEKTSCTYPATPPVVAATRP